MIIDSIKKTLQKHRELISYGIVGCVSVADSMFWFWLFLSPLKFPYMAANALGWIVDVWIVFILFKYFVFSSFEPGLFWKEAWKFISARLASGALDMGLLWLLIELFHFNVMAAKAIVIIIIIVVNYAAAKFFVFRQRNSHNSEMKG